MWFWYLNKGSSLEPSATAANNEHCLYLPIVVNRISVQSKYVFLSWLERFL
jgi:hypothetical protein